MTFKYRHHTTSFTEHLALDRVVRALYCEDDHKSPRLHLWLDGVRGELIYHGDIAERIWKELGVDFHGLDDDPGGIGDPFADLGDV